MIWTWKWKKKWVSTPFRQFFFKSLDLNSKMDFELLWMVQCNMFLPYPMCGQFFPQMTYPRICVQVIPSSNECWQQFKKQHITTLTQWQDSSFNTFSILKTKFTNIISFHFLLLKLIVLHNNHFFYINVKYVTFIIWQQKFFQQ